MIYSISANVFAKKVGPMFGRTTRAELDAKNEEEARNLASKSFEQYCASLKKHHGGEFEFNNLEIKEIG